MHGFRTVRFRHKQKKLCHKNAEESNLFHKNVRGIIVYYYHEYIQLYSDRISRIVLFERVSTSYCNNYFLRHG